MEIEAVKERGLKLGLNPRRTKTGEVGPPSKRKWRIIPAGLVQPGDIWADHGLVRVRVSMEATCIVAGEPIKEYAESNDSLLKVFTEVDMQYAKIDGKGATHLTTVSYDTDTYGATACGLEGNLKMVPDSEVKKVHQACIKAVEGPDGVSDGVG